MISDVYHRDLVILNLELCENSVLPCGWAGMPMTDDDDDDDNDDDDGGDDDDDDDDDDVDDDDDAWKGCVRFCRNVVMFVFSDSAFYRLRQ